MIGGEIMEENIEKQEEHLELKTTEGKKSFAVRKLKNGTDRMYFIIKKNGKVSINIEYACDEQFNYETQWSSKKCKEFLDALHNDKIQVLSVNGEKNSMCVLGRFYSNFKQYAWRLPDELKEGEEAVKVGDWVKIPYTGFGITSAYVDEIIPTYKLDFFPDKVVKNVIHYYGVRKLMTQEEYWQRNKSVKRHLKKKKELYLERKKAEAEAQKLADEQNEDVKIIDDNDK